MINRVHSQAHSLKLFQRDIFWPTLESLRDNNRELADLQRDEAGVLTQILDGENAHGIDHLLQQQRDMAQARAEKQAEIDRKWTLIHAGCHFMASQLAESDGLGELTPSLSPELIRRVLVDGAALHNNRLEVLELG